MNMQMVQDVGQEAGIQVVDPNAKQLQEAMKASVVQERIKEIQSKSLQTLLDKQNELVDRLEKLSELPDMAQAEEQRAIIEAELKSVRTEYAKRQEDMGVLANSLFALYDELGLQSQTANKEMPQDIAKRDAAQQAVADAQVNVGLKEAALTDAEGAWWNKTTRVALAKEDLKKAVEAVADAQANVAIVEEQIAVDKRDRVRKASIAESIALIREHTGRATSILISDIEKTEIRITSTQKSLESAVKKNVETMRTLDGVRDEIAKLQRDLDREKRAMGEIPDKNSVAFSEQQQIVIKLEGTLTEKSGQELQLNSMHMALVQAMEANKMSLNTLQIQRDTAKVYLAKLSTAEKTAEVLGQNIDMMFKNMIQQTGNSALDQVTDKMVVTTISLGTQIGVASVKDRNDAIERHLTFMKKIKDIEAISDQALATEMQRSQRIDQSMEQGYKDLGIDVAGMSNLLAAAQSTKPEVSQKADIGDVQY